VQYFRDLYNTQRIEVLKGPNAMIFGRGGGGGVINRVQKEADGVPIREVTVQGGSFDNKRVTIDTGGAVNENVAARINAMYENSGTYRDYGHLERYGINPTVTIRGEDTKVKLSYEYLHDDRTADRGIPAQGTVPAPTNARPTVPFATNAPSTFFGNPDQSYSKQDVHIANAVIEHDFNNGLSVKNSSRYRQLRQILSERLPDHGDVRHTGGIASISALQQPCSARKPLQSDRLDLQDQYRPRAAHHRVRYRVRTAEHLQPPQHRPDQRRHDPARSRVQPDHLCPVVVHPQQRLRQQLLCDARSRIGLCSGPDRESAATCSSSAAFVTTASTSRRRTSIRAAP
jgi:outer membrane receptor protein involved in Fe transport